jgi:hypothetical protein
MSEVNENVSYTQNPALIAGNTTESLQPVSVNVDAFTGLPSAEDLDRAAEEIELIANAQKALAAQQAATAGSLGTSTDGPTTTDPLAAEVVALRAEVEDLKDRIDRFNVRSGQKI